MSHDPIVISLRIESDLTYQVDPIKGKLWHKCPAGYGFWGLVAPLNVGENTDLTYTLSDHGFIRCIDLMWFTWYRELPAFGYTIIHKNGLVWDNRVTNLGLEKVIPEKINKINRPSMLSEADIERIQRLSALDVSVQELSRMYAVSPSTIYVALKRRVEK